MTPSSSIWPRSRRSTSADDEGEQIGTGIAERARLLSQFATPIRPQAGGDMTTSSKLQGVIAAIATAVDETGEPDCARSAALARFLLAHGCDGLNVLGTTGEATPFSPENRKRGKTANHGAMQPHASLTVGTVD